MPVYFLRHGESEANAKGVFAGQKENPSLTKKGIEQAEKAIQGVVGKQIFKIYCSPLKRALETADIVKQKSGLMSVPLIIDERLTEYDMGELSGTPWRAVDPKELVSIYGAEDLEEFRKRVIAFLQEHSDENILVVSHAIVGRVIEITRRRMSLADIYNIEPYPNASVVKLDLDWLKASNE